MVILTAIHLNVIAIQLQSKSFVVDIFNAMLYKLLMQWCNHTFFKWNKLNFASFFSPNQNKEWTIIFLMQPCLSYRANTVNESQQDSVKCIYRNALSNGKKEVCFGEHLHKRKYCYKKYPDFKHTSEFDGWKWNKKLRMFWINPVLTEQLSG